MMPAATWPLEDVRATRLLSVNATGRDIVDGVIGDLRSRLRPRDLLVVNDAATLPSSLRGETSRGAPIEVRLVGTGEDGVFRALALGEGDWRTPTEHRALAPSLGEGERLRFGELFGTVIAIDRTPSRWISIRFDHRGADLYGRIYRAGRPVQYAYMKGPLALWHVQTAYAARPWASEAPSAGFALTWDLLLDLMRAGVALARITHAAGLSSTGSAELDALLPLREAFDIPEATVRAVAEAHAHGGRVVAVGTTVARALEGSAAAHAGTLRAGRGTTDLRLGPASRRAVTDGILTGIHELGTSHAELLEAFAPRDLLTRALCEAEHRGYRAHEFGDTMLIASDRATLAP